MGSLGPVSPFLDGLRAFGSFLAFASEKQSLGIRSGMCLGQKSKQIRRHSKGVYKAFRGLVKASERFSAFLLKAFKGYPKWPPPRGPYTILIPLGGAISDSELSSLPLGGGHLG